MKLIYLVFSVVMEVEILVNDCHFPALCATKCNVD